MSETNPNKVISGRGLERIILETVGEDSANGRALEESLVSSLVRKTGRGEAIVRVNLHGMEHAGFLLSSNGEYALDTKGRARLRALRDAKRDA